jgi:DNA-binding MarR family transcriptional regulator
MPKCDFENSVGCWVFATMHGLTRAMNEELAALGITYRQWEVLAWISFAGELSQCELAERMSIEAPTLVGVLDRMERGGWIQRVPDAQDRRKKLIRPTGQVSSLWTQMVEGADRVTERAVKGLSAEEVDRLRETLAAIRQNLSAAPR